MGRRKAYKIASRSEEEITSLIRRLSRIEGQVKGIKRMVTEGKTCEELLIQLRSIDKSIKSISNEIVKDYMMTYVVEEVQNGNLTVLKQLDDFYKSLQ